MEQLLDNIEADIPNLSIYILDITYNIKIKNKDTFRYQRILFFGLNENFKKNKKLKRIFYGHNFSNNS